MTKTISTINWDEKQVALFIQMGMVILVNILSPLIDQDQKNQSETYSIVICNNDTSSDLCTRNTENKTQNKYDVTISY